MMVTVKVKITGKYYRRSIKDVEEFFNQNGGRVPLSVLMERFGHDTLAVFFRIYTCKIEFRVDGVGGNGKGDGEDD